MTKKPKQGTGGAVVKKFKDQEITQPYLLGFLRLYDENREDYSQSFLKFSMLPMFFWTKPDRINDRFLDSFERDFVYKKIKHRVRVSPAAIKDDEGRDRYVYQGTKESIILDTLIKMAADGRHAKTVLADGLLTVIFSRTDLQQELEKHGHTYAYRQINEAFDVMFKTSVELTVEGVEGTDNFHPISNYGIRGKDGEDFTYVTFCPMLTEALKTNSFRLINFKKLMSYKGVIARLLHKRFTDVFTQVDDTNNYHLSMNTMFRDFGLSLDTRVSARLIESRKAIEQLKEQKVVLSVSERKVHNAMRKNKIDDYIFEFTFHQDFINEVILANKDVKRRAGEKAMRENLKFLNFDDNGVKKLGKGIG